MEKVIIGNDSVVVTGNINSNPVEQKIIKPSVSTLASKYEIGMYGGDFFNITRTSNGQQLMEISEDPISPDSRHSYIKSKASFKFPGSVKFGLCSTIRARNAYFIAEATTGDDIGTEPEYALVSVSQSTTTLTVTLATPFDGYLGDYCDLYGLVDTRFNYSNLCVASISTNKMVLTFTINDDVGITSVTATAASVVGGVLKRIGDMFGSTNGVGMRFSGTTVGTFVPLAKFDGGDTKVFGTLVGSQLVTSASTAPLYVSATTGQYEIKPTSRFALIGDEDISYDDIGIDATTAWTTRARSTEVKPDYTKDYWFRLRSTSSLAMTRPIAKIKSISKTGTTTATVVTNVPHNLTLTSVVTISGVRDITNFANTTATVASIVNTTTFTIVLGTAVTASSYGGMVVIVNGGIGQQGLVAQNAQTVARDALGIVTLVGNTNWAGLGSVGEYVNLYGCLDSAGNELGFDGVYRIHNIATTNLLLEPIYDVGTTTLTKDGTGTALTPTGGVVTATNCGGGVILRNTIRISDVVVEQWVSTKVVLDGRGTYDIKKAIPVILVTGVTATQGNPAAISGTTGLGGWYFHPAIVGITDIASAAITSTSVSSSIANNLGNGFQVNITVSAVSGTTPTLDLKVEESFDGGATWSTLYDMQRITAIGSYNTPVMRASGRHIRYTRTITGTTPSFTNVVSRNILPFLPAEPQKRIMDRTISLTTANSTTPVLFQGAANNIQLVYNVTAITGTLGLQLEGSEDNVNWYSIGSPTSVTVAGTYQLTVNALSSTYTRAKVTTPATTATLGYVSIKAWS